MVRNSAWLLATLVIVVATNGAAAQVCGPQIDGDVAEVYYESNVIFWQPRVEFESMVLTVSAPCEEIVKKFGPKDEIFFDLKEIAREVDGRYSWELRAVPRVDEGVRRTLEEARGSGEEDRVWWSLWQQGAIPDGPFVESQAFSVVEGKIVDPTSGEEKRAVLPDGAAVVASASVAGLPAAGLSPDPGNGLSAKDYVINDDLIVDGSACIGFDCVNGESFGYDTIRIKENSLRIQFDDTSSLASYPTTNWQIRANDSTNGGASYLGFVDQGASGTSTDGDLVFAVEANAPNNALWIDDAGRAGFGTSTPVTEIHIMDGDTPTVRLQQDGSSGFGAQSWDVAGNETNFFIRDVTSGSKLPFRIRPGAPTSSIDVASDGDVGLGTASPEAALHISRAGTLRYRLENTSAGTEWDANNDANGDFSISLVGSGGSEFEIEQSGQIGNCGNPDHDFVISTGPSCTATPRSWIDAGDTSFSITSSRSVKEHLEPLQVPDILDKIGDVSVYRYDFVGGPKDRIGLMAEDFHQIFGRGSERELSGHEMQLALWLAVQELAKRTNEERMIELERENDELIARQEDLEREIHRLEERLATLVE